MSDVDDYHYFREELIKSLGIPSDFIKEALPSTVNGDNIYLKMFKRAAEKNLEEADRKLQEKVEELQKQIEDLVKSKKRKYRSIDEPFEPSKGD